MLYKNRKRAQKNWLVTGPSAALRGANRLQMTSNGGVQWRCGGSRSSL
ncbi:hypothetical protein CASFOL_024257 [Castilleja foliolosa]|uniref:Uncharacterized protein n=1 Tax=Castilleja foliolosa TaxID=1961234 RepID=A0ABD3CMU3_9LAMI